MPIQEASNCIFVKKVPTATAATDAAIVHIPYTGVGYVVTRVLQYNSRLLTTGATANNSTTTIGIFGAAAGGGAVIVADATATLASNTAVASRSVAATAATPLVTAPDLYIRVGTASGVANSCLDIAIEYSVLP